MTNLGQCLTLNWVAVKELHLSLGFTKGLFRVTIIVTTRVSLLC